MRGLLYEAPVRAGGVIMPARWQRSDVGPAEPARPVDRWAAADSFPELDGWKPVLDALSIAPPLAMRIAARARVLDLPFHTELIASGFAAEADVYAAVAAVLSVPYAAMLDPGRLILRDSECLMLLNARRGSTPVRVDDGDGHSVWAISPDGLGIKRLLGVVKSRPEERVRIWIVAPSTLRAALLERAAPLMLSQARNGLFERTPLLSARIVVNAWQGGALGVALVVLPLAFLAVPKIAFMLFHLFFTLFFLACVWLRFAAVRSPPVVPVPDFSNLHLSEMPVYSVVVALRREAEIVPQLLTALGALVWPRGKLEIKLVCEADDAETLAAIRAHKLPDHIEIVEVPPGEPRTKPKALSFALQIVKGEFVVLYDAEDRPHPMQLMEAWRRFAAGPPELACLQAPLEISNARASLIARMFAVEYCGLFRGLLPWLASLPVVLPLGGTSNHLRTSSLRDVGGWDPFNVTEDADLGLRLARFGLRTETLTLPTYEDSPETLGVWLPQRTRWFKGWAQTWLVHMRNPATLLRQLGPRSFAVAQILSAGMVVSALVHPVLVGTALYVGARLAMGEQLSLWQSSLLVIDFVNIACGYVSFLLLGWQPLRPVERKGFWRVVLLTPIYWLMLSWAAWRSVLQLCRNPHHWEKTPHVPVRT